MCIWNLFICTSRTYFGDASTVLTLRASSGFAMVQFHRKAQPKERHLAPNKHQDQNPAYWPIYFLSIVALPSLPRQSHWGHGLRSANDISECRVYNFLNNKSTHVDWTWPNMPGSHWVNGTLQAAGLVWPFGWKRVHLTFSLGSFLKFPSPMVRTNQCFKDKLIKLFVISHPVLCSFNDYLLTTFAVLSHQSAYPKGG